VSALCHPLLQLPRLPVPHCSSPTAPCSCACPSRSPQTRDAVSCHRTTRTCRPVGSSWRRTTWHSRGLGWTCAAPWQDGRTRSKEGSSHRTCSSPATRTAASRLKRGVIPLTPGCAATGDAEHLGLENKALERRFLNIPC